MFRGIWKGLLLWVPGILILAAPGLAQDRWGSPFMDPEPGPRSLDVSVSIGGLYSTDWSDLVLLGSVSASTGAFQQVLLRDVSVQPGPVANAAVTYWEGRYGFRVHGGFSRSCLAVGAACARPAPPAGEGVLLRAPEEEVGIDTWMVDVGGVVRLRDPERSRWWRPYVMLGWGGIAYDPEVEVADLLPQFVDVPRQQRTEEGNLRVTLDQGQGFLLSLDELGFSSSFAWTLGVGSDLRVPVGDGGVGLRVELTSHTIASPLRVRVLPFDGRGSGAGPGDFRTLDFGSVHNLKLTAGLVIELPLRERAP